MTLDINKLEQAALAATPGPWVACGPSFGAALPKYLNEVVIDKPGAENDGYTVAQAMCVVEEIGSDDMAYIAAANPAAVLELINRLRSATEQLTIERKYRLEELEEIQERMTEYHRERVELRQKLEAAEKDAARLNFLDENINKNMGWSCGVAPFGNVSMQSVLCSKKTVREAIDGAMKEKP